MCRESPSAPITMPREYERSTTPASKGFGRTERKAKASPTWVGGSVGDARRLGNQGGLPFIGTDHDATRTLAAKRKKK
jgi:hypothetical protein